MNILLTTMVSEGGLSAMFDVGQSSFIWTIAIFLISLPFMWKVVFGPIAKALEDREEATRQAAQVAEAAREETETLRTEIEADLAEARREARDRVREAESRAEAKEKEILAKARDEAERERQRSREEIESAKASALEELRATAVELGVGIAEKAISREFRSEDQQRLVSELQRDLSKN
ncbi:MAG TPA: F0F1 ATP synthase subunit B [Planctomycetota bacterium]|jgi:F-type H+-transporting ATPase subunit b|nr:ATP synthase F0 subunit B [Planctomycetota bacterium]MDP6129244.1 F0F1 ATP synthase subunit B [Planctomycetota bacterium]MDP7246041.1 F0F1 ATP synthase subunit B [Planctomycetota bacterium]HJM40419.1 F0F1 ATP synthase subunit B [Planctomycetota bacterium]